MAPAVPETPVGVKTIRFGVLKFGAVEQVKKLGPKLDCHSLADCGVFECGEVPCAQAWTVRVSRPRLPQNPLLAGGARNALGLNHCAGLAESDRPVEVGIHERSHGIAGVTIVGGVVAELRSDRKAGL